MRARGMLGVPWWAEVERGWHLKKGWEQEDPSSDTLPVIIGPYSITHRAGPEKGLMDVDLQVAKVFFSLWT